MSNLTDLDKHDLVKTADAARSTFLLAAANNLSGAGDLDTNLDLLSESCWSTSHDAIIADIPGSDHTFTKLWEAHVDIRARYVAALKRLQSAPSKISKEYNDTAKSFIKFIKAGQSGYRKLVRSIVSQVPSSLGFSGAVPEEFASLLGNIGSLSSDDHIGESHLLKARKYATESLIYLGDLSRWRHKANVDKSKTSGWKIALSYYSLAHDVDPDSGLAEHQLAVLAQEDGKYFPAAAYLFQSLCTRVPHANAANNLHMLMTKRLAMPITKLIPKVAPSNDDQANTIATLRGWFLLLHTNFYKCADFDGYIEMESEVLERLASALKNGVNLGNTLLQMTIINIAAEHIHYKDAKAGVKPQENAQGFFFCFQHNVKTFAVLLRHFEEKTLADLSQPVRFIYPSAAMITVQAIRVYSNWFLTQQHFMQECMQNNTPSPEVAEDVRQLWWIYARVLTAIGRLGHMDQFPDIRSRDYLVDEEIEMLCFKPVYNDLTTDLFLKQDGGQKAISRKKRSDEEDQMVHLSRLRDIFVRGGIVAQHPSSFLHFQGEEIVYGDPKDPIFSPPPPAPEDVTREATPPPHADHSLNVFIYQFPWIPLCAADWVWHDSQIANQEITPWSGRPFGDGPLYPQEMG